MPSFTRITPKSILNVRKQPDPWFWDAYSINPYNGCAFGCIYCDARSKYYQQPLHFEEEIVVKDGAAALLDKRLKNARTLRPDVVALSGVTDAYQPSERTYRVTRSLLEVLARHRWPVHIITKSKLVLEDLDLLRQIARDTWCTVSVTLSTVDRADARFLDKYAPDPEQRLEIIRTLRVEVPEIQTGILMMPLVPGIGDTRVAMTATVDAATAAGAQYVLFAAGMSMRDTQASHFWRQLQQHRPRLLPAYRKIYAGGMEAGGYRGAANPSKAYAQKRNQFMLELLEGREMPWTIPRFIPDDDRSRGYLLAERVYKEARRRSYLDVPAQNWYQIARELETRVPATEILKKLLSTSPILPFLREIM